MKRKSTKSMSILEHKLALNKYIELNKELWSSSNFYSFFIETKTDLSTDKWIHCIKYLKANQCHNKISSYLYDDFEIHTPEAEPNIIFEIIQSLFAYTSELFNKIKNLKIIIESFSRVKSLIADFDKRKMIQRLKHNFRHFDDEENNELKVERKQFYNSLIITPSWKNLKINLMKYFPSMNLTVN
ncbi:hypothetical protein ACFO4P_16970 [Epilithonimonas pallida]|uniref:Uncharacterized protein n=1 Tax=Epilithonimonas pallida TaxID=373671 RepID=A0ABY1R6E9_9FLAO|nr:hypothetical protein [Epilithonimonas pallida]SMP94676.1 hypothetical protein SAMN05421679_10679 [Epilithonimonas pallida]